jgi:hypothetical protein
MHEAGHAVAHWALDPYRERPIYYAEITRDGNEIAPNMLGVFAAVRPSGTSPEEYEYIAVELAEARATGGSEIYAKHYGGNGLRTLATKLPFCMQVRLPRLLPQVSQLRTFLQTEN